MVIRGFSGTAVPIHRVMGITMAVALTAAGMAGMVAVATVEAGIECNMKGDVYTQGRHFWTHFVYGLIVGSITGAHIFWSVFDSRMAFWGAALIFAVVFALAVGCWGDPLWRRLIS